MVPTWKTKKEKTSKFVDAGGYYRNERAGIGDLEWVDREGRRKKSKFTLGTERCENMKNLYVCKLKIKN